MSYKPILLFSFILASAIATAQDLKVLHYTETSGYDHGTRNVSLDMFEDLGDIQGFTVDDDQTGDAFDSVENLEQYAVVVFSNTSGNGILNASQRSNFESYINGGGAYIGIHAASDTYRHSTANGGSTGTWDWYAEMAGASVQQSPNHTSANYSGTMDHLMSSPILDEIPDPWDKVEEYYYWENGYYNDSNVGLLQVQSTGGQSYDAPRPMAWFKELAGGGRSFYTALGHAQSNFTSDDDFRQLISNALEWAMATEDVDCAGVPGGSSVLDDCGVCHLPDDPDFNSTCLDCAGVPNGTSETDLCDNCLEDGEENPLWNACVDCNGVPNGDAFEDDCGDCVGGDTGLEPCAEDCAGEPGGSSVLDDCGVCRLPDDPDFNSTCLDCAGVPNGTSETDLCDNCLEDGEENPLWNACLDCNGVPNGDAFEDDCGECVGGDTSLEPCTEDCAGEPGGSSVLDDCGVCRLPDDPDFNSTCLDCAGVPNGTSETDLCGNCLEDGEENPLWNACVDCNGVPNGDAFEDDCGDCVGGDTGLEACTEDCAGEPGGSSVLDDCGVCRLPDDPDFNSTCLDCAGVPNGTSETDLCENCLEDGEENPLWNACVDCNGVPNGEAFEDECGDCVGGDTGLEPCAEDCAGEPGGISVLDDCGVCRLPDDPDFNSTCLDCAGVPNGTSETDLCDNCLEDGEENPLWNACVDCNGVPNGDAFEDECGDCVGGDTGLEPCTEDCAGVPGGSSVLDDCGVCRLPDDPDFNSTCLDCAGVPNGTSEIDLCDNCLEDGEENPLWNACVDCNGVPNGDAFEDDCGNCVGGDTGEEPCSGSLSGSVDWNSACDSRSGVVSVYESGTDNLVETVNIDVSPEGTFEASGLPIGTFDIYLKVAGFLQKLAINIVVETEGTAVDFGNLTPGELSGDSAITVPDFSAFSAAYGSSEGDASFNFLADFNCDGAIDIQDYSLFSSLYGSTGDNPELSPTE